MSRLTGPPFGVATLMVLALLTAVPMARAQIIDPPLFIGNTASCPTSSFGSGAGMCTPLGTGPVVGGEGVGIASNTLTIFNQGVNSATVQTPILLLIAVPNAPSGYTPPSISGVMTTGSGSWSGVLGGADVYGGTWKTSTGAATSALVPPAPSTNPSVYNLAGLVNDDGGSSENWTNLSTLGGQVLGTTPSFFDIFVYTLTGTPVGTNLAKGQFLTVNFNGSGLTLGTFAMAYGCESGSSTSIDCTGSNVYATPFTHVGVVPEPSTWIMLGSGLLLGGIFRGRLIVGG